MGDVQISMFARRIYIPGYFSLSEKQQRSLWDFMAEVYDDLVDLPQKLRVFELFNQYVPTRSRVIDAGCGTGLYGRYAKPQETQLIGIDFSAEMVSRSLAAGVYDEVMHQSLVEPWPVKDKSVGGVLVSFVSHLVDLERVAREAQRVLSPGGVLLVNLYEPQPGWQEKYRNQFEELGFETVHLFDEQVGEKEIKGLVLRLRHI
jgi:predicted TPR repeat methyltransferase